MWHSIITGQEPIIIRGVVVLVVAVAAMFGQIIDPNVVLAVIIFLVPAAISARGQVSPSETRFSWLSRLKDMFLEAPLQEGYTGGPVDPNAVEPDWVEEYQNIEDEFEDLYDRYTNQAGVVIEDVKEEIEDLTDQAEEVVDQVEDAVDDLQDKWDDALAGDE